MRECPNSKPEDTLLLLPDGGPAMKRLSKKLNKTQHGMFSSDPTLHLDLNGLDDETRDSAILYIEEAQNLPSSPNADLPRRRAVADVFKLHSRPGGSKVIDAGDHRVRRRQRRLPPPLLELRPAVRPARAHLAAARLRVPGHLVQH